MDIMMPNRSPEPPAVGAVISAVAVRVASRRCLLFSLGDFTLMRLSVGILFLVSLTGCSSSHPTTPLTRLPEVHHQNQVIVSPDARIRGVTAEEVSQATAVLAAQTQCRVDGPIIALGKDTVAGKEHLFAMTLVTMFEFVRSGSGDWELASCGPYNY